MLLRISGWQKSGYPMPRKHYQSISQFMACDEFCAFVNEICDLIGFIINSYLSLALVSLVNAGML